MLLFCFLPLHNLFAIVDDYSLEAGAEHIGLLIGGFRRDANKLEVEGCGCIGVITPDFLVSTREGILRGSTTVVDSLRLVAGIYEQLHVGKVQQAENLSLIGY